MIHRQYSSFFAQTKTHSSVFEQVIIGNLGVESSLVNLEAVVCDTVQAVLIHCS